MEKQIVASFAQPVKIKLGPRYSLHIAEIGWLCLMSHMTLITVGILYVASQISFTLQGFCFVVKTGLYTNLIVRKTLIS